MTHPPQSQAALPADLADVRRKLEQLAAAGQIPELIELVLGLLVQLRDKNTALSAKLANALRELYGRKSQKVSTEQLMLLFAEFGAEAPQGTAGSELGAEAPPQPEPGLVPQPPELPKPPRGRRGRAPLPAHLPRETRVVAVPEAERKCPQCGADKKCIGHRTSEVLEFVPAQFRIIEEKREKLVCPSCPEQGVTTADSEKVMDRGRPGPGLLASIIVEKFEDAMPLYRQAQQYARCGVSLSPSTLGEWSAFALDVLASVAKRIQERVLGSCYLRADDTGMRVLDQDHPAGVKRGHIWGFVGANLVAFVYAPDWSAKHPAALLQGFTGYLQGDGYAGYGAMLRGDDDGEAIVPDERRLGCGMHIRAKFEKAARGGDARAAVALAYFKAIYRIEAACKAEALSAEARLTRRQEQSLPVVDELYQWIHELHLRLVPNTPLYVATQYAINHEGAWRRCFTDGRFEIDNGEFERRIRSVALGRRNYLFAGSDKGAERLAVGYTVFGSCRMHGVNPLAWATDVIGKLQAGWPRERLDELLPDAWARASLAAPAAGDADAS
ncbi:IS66 family transposase [Sorangium cellulosum]|uniref:Transposase n=1 Tax=Sorangium cellulosum So0157-2 TaxID=1254432 RepID=S4Y9G7_SORCE|nr:IS66 family transposase [Sorangium cellulosum]AGP39443.1 transposase [Sorangium cellulosum So0157-2]